MFEEHEKEIRTRVDAFKASGKKLSRGNYATCLIGIVGGIAVCIDWLGETATIAMECGFEGYGEGTSGCALLKPEYFDLGKRIAEENGLK